jgi:hypothetical protein
MSVFKKSGLPVSITLTLFASAAHAQYTFNDNISVPGSNAWNATLPTYNTNGPTINNINGINNSGTVVGSFNGNGTTSDGSPSYGASGNVYGFVNNTVINYTKDSQGNAANSVVAYGINDSGSIVGSITGSTTSGFYSTTANYTTASPTHYLNDTVVEGGATAQNSVAVGITNTSNLIDTTGHAVVIGESQVLNGSAQGNYIFEYNTGTGVYTDMVGPGGVASNYEVSSVSSDGQYIGGTVASGSQSGFVYDTQSKTWIPIVDSNGVNGTYVTGVNNSGLVAGIYTDANYVNYGFIYSLTAHAFVAEGIVDPSGNDPTNLGNSGHNGLGLGQGSIGFTGLAINEQGVLGGSTTAGYSFTATPSTSAVPLPASAWMMLSGLMGFFWSGRSRNSSK